MQRNDRPDATGAQTPNRGALPDFDLASSRRGDTLVVTFAGVSTSANAAAMMKRYFEIVQASDLTKVLADIRQLKGRLPAGETYFLVRDLPVRPVPNRIRTAIVESKENRAYAEFLEATASNAGVQFKCFLDHDDAISWLAAS